MTAASQPEWGALLELVGPFHAEAHLCARRLARSRAEGDDLFQEALLRAAHKLATLRDPARFRPWFFQLLFALHRSRCRRAFWRRLVSFDHDGDAAAAELDDRGEHWLQRHDAERAAAALATLPAVQREAIVLFELHGHTIEEIGELQRASLSAVKTRLARGRDRLRRHYAELGEPAARVIGDPLPCQERLP